VQIDDGPDMGCQFHVQLMLDVGVKTVIGLCEMMGSQSTKKFSLSPKSILCEVNKTTTEVVRKVSAVLLIKSKPWVEFDQGYVNLSQSIRR
jgi:hypothetical protein